MTHKVLVPPLGQTVDVVTLVQWYKQEGEVVKEGEPLFIIATDKADLDIEAQASGILCKVSAKKGDEVVALSTIALIVAPDIFVSDILSPDILVPDEATAEPLTAPDAGLPYPQTFASDLASTAREQHAQHNNTRGKRLFVSPRARSLAAASGVKLDQLVGTGPEGAIVERDVLRYAEEHSKKRIATPVAERMARSEGVDLSQISGSGQQGWINRKDVEMAINSATTNIGTQLPMRPDNEFVVEEPLRGIRSIIAERMIQSLSSSAQLTLSVEADATALVALRQQLAIDGVIVTYNDLLLYITGRALLDFPQLNASLEDQVIRQWQRVHIGVAVDTERGLFVPVVRDVVTKRLTQLAIETAALIQRTRENQINPAELRGGTFTLTNLGMVGIDIFTPILNPPETAILGVGRIKERPAVLDHAVVVRQMLWLSLTFDHRVVDGAYAARFLQRVVQLVEHPHLMHA